MFYDDELSVLVEELIDSVLRNACCVPWGFPSGCSGYADFVGVLRFGDWSVMRSPFLSQNFPPAVGAGGLWILDNQVAPDN